MKPRINPIFATQTKTCKPNAIGDACFRDERMSEKRRMELLFRKQSAAEFIRHLTTGSQLFGFTKGQFSLIDVIQAVTKDIGKCELTMSTWTAAKADLLELQNMMETGAFSSLRMLLDFSFQRRQPSLLKTIRDRYGPESVVITRNHAKFCLMKTANLRIVIRTSMNLNFNPRLEDLDVKEDPQLFEFIDGIVSQFFSSHDPKTQAAKTIKELGSQFTLFDPK